MPISNLAKVTGLLNFNFAFPKTVELFEIIYHVKVYGSTGMKI